MSRTLLILAMRVPRYTPLLLPLPVPKIQVQIRIRIQPQLKLRRPYASSSSSSSFQSQQKSTVHRGNAFEERSLKILEQTMSMSLKRVGGKEDGGIDLMGWWWLPDPSDGPSSLDLNANANANAKSDLETQSECLGTHNDDGMVTRRRIRIIGQCKAEKKKMGPGYVRELEGVVFRYMSMSSFSSLSTSSSSSSSFLASSEASSTSPGPGPSPFTQLPTHKLLKEEGREEGTVEGYGHGQYQIPMVALLVSESPFTKSALLRAHSSPIPFFLLHLPPLEDALSSSTSSASAPAKALGSPPSGEPDLDTNINTTLKAQSVNPNGYLGAAVCNPALSGAQGLLKGQLEVRWERSGVVGDHQLQQRQQAQAQAQAQAQGRPGLWWKNKRLSSLTRPPDHEADTWTTTDGCRTLDIGP